MKEKNSKSNKKSAENKDYYFSVLVTQMFCCSALVLLFFALKGSGDGSLVKEYDAIIREDAFGEAIIDAVGNFRNYINEGKSSAVFSGTAVYSGNMHDNKASLTSGDVLKEGVLKSESATELESEPLAVQSISLGYKKDESLTDILTLKKESMLFPPVSQGRYTSYFGSRDDPFDGSADYHGGVDIGADLGEKIRAAHDGIITEVGYDSVSGNYVFLRYNNAFETFYCHCSEIIASEGDVVRQGETIALVGSTGASTGPHLHFEVRVDGEKVNPVTYLGNAY